MIFIYTSAKRYRNMTCITYSTGNMGLIKCHVTSLTQKFKQY